MPGESTVPLPVLELVTELADAYAERMAPQLAELAQAMRDPSPVRVVPSDRWTPWTFGVPARADRILGWQADRARATLVNTGPELIALGNDETLSLSTSSRTDLPPGATLTLDTHAAIWAISVTGAGLLAVIVEEWDL